MFTYDHTGASDLCSLLQFLAGLIIDVSELCELGCIQVLQLCRVCDQYSKQQVYRNNCVLIASSASSGYRCKLMLYCKVILMRPSQYEVTLHSVCPDRLV